MNTTRNTALAAMQYGKHVLIEKPMCLTHQEAEAIINARHDAGVQVMVGYMRVSDKNLGLP